MSLARLLRLLCISCLWLAPGARAAIELRAAAQEETAPKYIKGDADEPSGLCVDLLRALERADPTLRFVDGERWFPLIRVQSEMFAGKQDVACGLAHTGERDRHLTYLDPPLVSIDYVLIARKADKVQISVWNDVRHLGADGVVLGNRGLFDLVAFIAHGIADQRHGGQGRTQFVRHDTDGGQRVIEVLASQVG